MSVARQVTSVLFHSRKLIESSIKPGRLIRNYALVIIGYILSPLSWWNDMVINVPLAYAFSFPFSLISQQLFLPAFLLGYWLTNLLGFLFMHYGMADLARSSSIRISWINAIMTSAMYSMVIVLLYSAGWIPLPDEILIHLR